MLLQLMSVAFGFLCGLWYATSVIRSGRTFFKTLLNAKDTHQAGKRYLRDSLLRVVIVIPLFGVLAWWCSISMLFLLLGLVMAFVDKGVFAVRQDNGNKCL